MVQENDTYWIVELTGDKANLSVCSAEEAEAMQEMDSFDDWMIGHTQKVTKEDMEDRIEEHGYEFDPWA